MSRSARIGFVVVMFLVPAFAPGATLRAGGLSPPAGPVAPTMKTLDEVEARIPVNTLPGDSTASHVITQPGSYYLTGNIAGQPQLHGIVIEASDVTLDLNGFALVGSATQTREGIFVRGDRRNIVVRNGLVRDWRYGVRAWEGSNRAISATFDSLVIANNQLDGLQIGTDTLVRDSVIRDNGGAGVLCHGRNVRIERTSVLRNAALGVVLSDGGTLRDSEIIDNTGPGVMTGFALTRMSYAVNTVVQGNQGGGFRDVELIAIENCFVTRNHQSGVQVLWRTTIRNSDISHNHGNGVSVTGPYSENQTQIDNNIIAFNEGWGVHVGSVFNSVAVTRNAVHFNLNQIHLGGDNHGSSTDDSALAGGWQNLIQD